MDIKVTATLPYIDNTLPLIYDMENYSSFFDYTLSSQKQRKEGKLYFKIKLSYIVEDRNNQPKGELSVETAYTLHSIHTKSELCKYFTVALKMK